MKFYRVCDNCGAHLDPGENCDCRIESLGRNKRTNVLHVEKGHFRKLEKNHIKSFKELESV